MAEYQGPNGWIQGQRAGTWITKEGLLGFFADYLGLLAKYGHAEESAPPGPRPIAVRFLAIPEDEPPAHGAAAGSG